MHSQLVFILVNNFLLISLQELKDYWINRRVCILSRYLQTMTVLLRINPFQEFIGCKKGNITIQSRKHFEFAKKKPNKPQTKTNHNNNKKTLTKIINPGSFGSLIYTPTERFFWSYFLDNTSNVLFHFCFTIHKIVLLLCSSSVLCNFNFL